jgi:IS5 family transposase
LDCLENGMRQQSFTAEDFEKYRKKTRKEVFLEGMDKIVPRKEMGEAVKPYYPAAKGAGRRPIVIERMLRIQFLQRWFELSDPGVEEALYDSRSTPRLMLLWV